MLAVGVLEGDLASASTKGVSGEAGETGSISQVGGFAERIEWFAGLGSLVVEISGVASGADSSSVGGFAEGVLVLASKDAGSSTGLITRVASGAGSIAEIILAERVDWDALVVVSKIVSV